MPATNNNPNVLHHFPFISLKLLPMDSNKLRPSKNKTGMERDNTTIKNIPGIIKREKPLHWHFYDPWGGPQSLMRDGDYMLGSNWDVGDFHKKGRFDPAEVDVIKKSKLANFQLFLLCVPCGLP